MDILRRRASRSRTTSLNLVALAAAVAIAVAAPASADAPSTDEEYWDLADRMTAALDHRWSEQRGFYAVPGRGVQTRENSAMLTAHAIAALEGHTGATRRDGRARALVDALTRRPAWLGTTPAPGGYSTCWSMLLDRPVRQHMSLEPKVADALAWAWRARRRIGLPAGLVGRIERTVGTCAHSSAWRYPRVLENQINWNAEMYAAATTVTGRADLLRRDYRRQLIRFARGITRPMPGRLVPNLGRGYQFHYHLDLPDGAGINLDTPEYANITLHALAHYDRAVRLGMRPLPRPLIRRLRAWVGRVLAGAWTHAGYLNWDTGYGHRRWHSAQYWAFALQGPLAIATSPRFWGRRDHGRWAKALFDRGLELYRRLADEAGQALAPQHMFGVHVSMEAYECFCARMLATVVRAVATGLGSLPAEDPPPLYAYDYDTGRLAVTTPSYSTAILADSRGVIGYGGIDPARLFAGGQRVAANVGGTPPGAFGVVVTGAGGRELLASQHARVRRRLPLRIVRSPRGRLTRPRAYPATPYAGPFSDLEARAAVARGGLRIGASHRFSPRTITSRWRISCRGRCGPYRVRGHFPSWGERARIDAFLRDGRRVRLAGPGAMPVGSLRLSSLARLRIASVGGGGYHVVPLDAPPMATVGVVPAARERSNPHPGPSVAVQLVAGARFHERLLRVRVRPFVAVATPRRAP